MASLNDVLVDFVYDANLTEKVTLKADTTTALIAEVDVERLVAEGKIGPTRPFTRSPILRGRK